MTNLLNLNLTFDQPQLPATGDAVRHLIARIEPPAPDPAREQPPLDLAIVIDASGSMSGAPLEAAKEATLRLARELPATTRLTVVSFAEDVVVHVDAMPLQEANRTAIHRQIAGLAARGCTDLHGGWQTGCALLSPAESLAAKRRCHVVLLSDGHANCGVVEPEELAVQAGRQLESGISTSCVGIGDGYSQVQLAALSEHGGGECHDAENAVEIVEVLLGEVLSLAEVVAENVQLAIEVLPGITARERSGMPGAFDGQTLLVPIGAVRAGVVREVVIRLEIPASVEILPGCGPITASGHVEWRDLGSSERRIGMPARVAAERTGGRIELPLAADARTVLVAWQADLVRQVTELNRDRDFAGLERLWQAEFDVFVAYAKRHRETRHFITTIERMRAHSIRPMSERSRKQAYDLSMKMARQVPVYYSAQKGGVAEQFGEGDGGRRRRGTS